MVRALADEMHSPREGQLRWREGRSVCLDLRSSTNMDPGGRVEVSVSPRGPHIWGMCRGTRQWEIRVPPSGKDGQEYLNLGWERLQELVAQNQDEEKEKENLAKTWRRGKALS